MNEGTRTRERVDDLDLPWRAFRAIEPPKEKSIDMTGHGLSCTPTSKGERQRLDEIGAVGVTRQRVPHFRTLFPVPGGARSLLGAFVKPL